MVLLPVIELDTFRMRGRSRAADGGEEQSFDRLGFASAIGGVAQRFFEKLYQQHPTVDSRAIVTVLASSVGGAVLGTVPRPLQSFVPSSLREFADEIFEPTRARVELDGQRLAYEEFASLQVGSIDINLAGVVRCFRHAHEDGVLHFQAISTSPVGVVFNVPNIVFGTPIRGRNVYDDRARRISIVAAEGDRINPVIDGEQFYGLDRVDLELGPSLHIATLPAA